jgi:bacteriorhodopsin
MMFDMTTFQYQLVYNTLSFSLACMGASTIFFFFRSSAVHEKYKNALLISGLVTFIAAYHYTRIFNSWVEAYNFEPNMTAPVMTGIPFNDAYRYMDWLLTVPLLLVEILLCMKLSDEQFKVEAKSLALQSAAMIAVGYPGELIVEGWLLIIRFGCFCYSSYIFKGIVEKLLVGLKEAINSEKDPKVADMLNQVCKMTVISWCTYPIVYFFPFVGLYGSDAVVSIQVGYCVSDVISKCGVGLLIYKITVAKSEALEGALLPQ